MGMLWRHLDRSTALEECRRVSGREQCREVRRLAAERLTGHLLEQVLAAAAAAKAARGAVEDAMVCPSTGVGDTSADRLAWRSGTSLSASPGCNEIVDSVAAGGDR